MAQAPYSRLPLSLLGILLVLRDCLLLTHLIRARPPGSSPCVCVGDILLLRREGLTDSELRPPVGPQADISSALFLRYAGTWTAAGASSLPQVSAPL